MINKFNLIESFVFFGSSRFSEIVLSELIRLDFKPALVVTLPPAKAGRGLKLREPAIKTLAEKNGIPVYAPAVLDKEAESRLKVFRHSFFLVASYGKILPENFLQLTDKGAINIHPSLLPLYRGPSPIQYQIINDEKNVGVTLILMDQQIDHGPIIAQKKVELENWPLAYEILEKLLAESGAELFAENISEYFSGKVKPIPQKDDLATFTKKISKDEGLIDLNGNQRANYLKFLAFNLSPGIFFIPSSARNIKVKITKAEYQDGNFLPLEVIPAGKRPMSYISFKQGYKI